MLLQDLGVVDPNTLMQDYFCFLQGCVICICVREASSSTCAVGQTMVALPCSTETGRADVDVYSFASLNAQAKLINIFGN